MGEERSRQRKNIYKDIEVNNGMLCLSDFKACGGARSEVASTERKGSEETGQAPSTRTSHARLRSSDFIQNETGETEWF